jgi:hypothetical protein
MGPAIRGRGVFPSRRRRQFSGFLFFLCFMGTKVKRHDDLFLPVLHMILHHITPVSPSKLPSCCISEPVMARLWGS